MGASFYNQTTLHPLGALALAVLGLALLLVRREYAIIPIIIMACFVAPAQRIVVASLDFNMIRIMVLVGVVRVVLHSEVRGFAWKPMDTAVTLMTITGTVIYSIQPYSAGGATNALGAAFDSMGMYFLFRCLIRSWADFHTTVVGFTIVSVPVLMFFLVEQFTGRNLFSVLGGVPAITDVRQGRLRCQGAFAHSILAGCFWASLLPLFAAQWWRPGRGKQLAVTGIVTTLMLVVLCSSSTPLAAVIMASVAVMFFPLRHHMGYVRLCIVLLLIALHLSMKVPVWHLISRMDLLGGSTGWHRYYLIDTWIKHFDEWWALGNARAGEWGWGLHDITDHYVLVALNGGLATLVLFLWVIVLAYRGVGRMVRQAEGDRARLVRAWAVGVSLFVHTMSFIAVSYFGQITFLWYFTIALIGSLAPAAVGRAAAVRKRVVARQPGPVVWPGALNDRAAEGAATQGTVS